MSAERILKAIKNILDRDIKELQKKVLDEEENTFVNSALCKAKAIKQSIDNYKELYKYEK